MGGVKRQTSAWLLLMMILALWSMNTDGQTTTATPGTTAPPPETTTSGFQCPVNSPCNESQCRDGEGCETNQECCPVTATCSVCVNVTTPDGQTTTTTPGTTAPPPETTTSGFQCPVNYPCNESQCRDGEGCDTNQKCCPITDTCSVCVNVTTPVCDLEGGTMAEGESRRADDDCNTCTCRAGQLVCTERTCGPPCQMQVLQTCYIQLFEASFFIGAADDTHYMCRSRAKLEACVEQNLSACRDQLGHVKSLILGSYPKVLKVMGDLLCSMDTKTGSRAVIGNAGSCLVDFANVAVYGLTSLTCKQLAITRRCLVEATQSCSDQLKNIFSLVTSTLDTTGRTVCAPDTCNLLMAEQCINDGYVTNAAPIYRGQGSIIYCRWLKKSLTCAATHTASCSHYFEKTSESEGSMDSVEQNGATPSDISEQFDPSVFKQWVFSDKLFKEQPFENWSEDMPEVETDTESKTVLEKYLGMVQELRDAFNNVTQKQQGEF